LAISFGSSIRPPALYSFGQCLSGTDLLSDPTNCQAFCIDLQGTWAPHGGTISRGRLFPSAILYI
jgi:hypothetical protein